MNRFIGPTTACWQSILPAGCVLPEAPFRYRYPARLPDGTTLELPLRQVPGEDDQAVASLIANQASFEVVSALTLHMADLARGFAPTAIVGLPTLGLAFAPGVAAAIGHARYVPLGYSRKYWYDDRLSVPVRSLTTPGAGKTLYLDPNIRSLLDGGRILIVDDAVSTGQTLAASLDLLSPIAAQGGGSIVGAVVAMIQGERWRERLGAAYPDWPARVRGVFYSPRLRWMGEGWVPVNPTCH